MEVDVELATDSTGVGTIPSADVPFGNANSTSAPLEKPSVLGETRSELPARTNVRCGIVNVLPIERTIHRERSSVRPARFSIITPPSSMSDNASSTLSTVTMNWSATASFCSGISRTTTYRPGYSKRCITTAVSAVVPSPKFQWKREKSMIFFRSSYARALNSVSAPTTTVRSLPPSANTLGGGGMMESPELFPVLTLWTVPVAALVSEFEDEAPVPIVMFCVTVHEISHSPTGQFGQERLSSSGLRDILTVRVCVPSWASL